MTSHPRSSFHQFPLLPAELQIEIWEFFAWDALVPRVHFMKVFNYDGEDLEPFVRTEVGSPESTELSKASGYHSGRKFTWITSQAMTCHTSLAAFQRVCKLKKISLPKQNPYLHSTPNRPSFKSNVNPEVDLLVLSTRNEYSVHQGKTPTAGDNLTPLINEVAKYVAVDADCCPNEMCRLVAAFSHALALTHLSVFKELKSIYFVYYVRTQPSVVGIPTTGKKWNDNLGRTYFELELELVDFNHDAMRADSWLERLVDLTNSFLTNMNGAALVPDGLLARINVGVLCCVDPRIP
ncbi:hypothetical protein QBC38DRAFT_491850 [Podospora fimiseda]|uniref:2EXR domain-containing protein n=1 Tax=Podospora fimiseda TaxID=252190 RepID=A0AAN6YP12_9PEZI|nr:hypothetical protein QBC38DRAFT_491850 [Podospora fimiseda]